MKSAASARRPRGIGARLMSRLMVMLLPVWSDTVEKGMVMNPLVMAMMLVVAMTC